ncbi:ABC transporter permease [Ferroacidibacillus organovorans]|uniref:Multidrug ABC transporter substrate-binding protein n=1 Tax=Ferroacidibacillus organovorans TaxID=1765683 RepID=A0A101XPM9_9BACL|nr:ABC transporter permease [Ferroacidibacillus organovorans]KUO95232.1 multidrug ABC transporter substrate-binding protein [Ferroacidibacillus organovorans]
MPIRDTFRVAMRSIFANKMRSILTMLGIIIGVASVIALSAVGTVATHGITAQIESLGTNLLTINSGSASVGGVGAGFGSQPTLLGTDAAAIAASDPDVAYASPMIQSNGQVVYQMNNNSVTVQGVNSDYPMIKNLTVSAGRFFSAQEVARSENVVVLGSDIAQTLFAGTNTSPVGAVIDIKQIPFTVVGVLAAQNTIGVQNPNDYAEIPYTTAMNLFTGSPYVNSILVSAQSPSVMMQAQGEITSTLRFLHHLGTGQASDFQIFNQATTLSALSSITTLISEVLSGVAGISLIVGGIGIMNIMLVSVTERTREIGIRKAIGARRSIILFQFLVESVVLSLSGALLGVLIGGGGAELVGVLMKQGSLVSLTSILVSVLFALAVGTIFGVYPARKAARLNTIEALRYE